MSLTTTIQNATQTLIDHPAPLMAWRTATATAAPLHRCSDADSATPPPPRLLLWLLLWLLRFSHGRLGLACRCHAAGAGRHSRQARYCQSATLAALPPHTRSFHAAATQPLLHPPRAHKLPQPRSHR